METDSKSCFKGLWRNGWDGVEVDSNVLELWIQGSSWAILLEISLKINLRKQTPHRNTQDRLNQSFKSLVGSDIHKVSSVEAKLIQNSLSFLSWLLECPIELLVPNGLKIYRSPLYLEEIRE